MIEVRLTVIFNPDTDDKEETLIETRDLMRMIQDSWYDGARFGQEVRVIERDDD